MTPETIAIVEDDAAIRAVLTVALKSAGCSLVCEAERGDEGLRLVRERQPSLVLLDVMMPERVVQGCSVSFVFRSILNNAEQP